MWHCQDFTIDSLLAVAGCADTYFLQTQLNDYFRHEEKKIGKTYSIGMFALQRLEFIFQIITQMAEDPVMLVFTKGRQLINGIACSGCYRAGGACGQQAFKTVMG